MDPQATDDVVYHVAISPEFTVVHRGVVHVHISGGGVPAIHQLYICVESPFSVPIHPTMLQVLETQAPHVHG